MAGLPYTTFPRAMTRAMVEHCVDLSNSFPNEQGISNTLSLNAMVEGKQKIDYNNLKTPFGSYTQVYIGTKNDTVGGIALKPSNEKGGYYFMSLFSGKKIHAMRWKDLPISDNAVHRVHELALDQEQHMRWKMDRYLNGSQGHQFLMLTEKRSLQTKTLQEQK